MIEIFAGISLIVLASAVHKYVERRGNAAVPGDVEERIHERLNDLDRRITDVQDILITIDEKLKRQ